MKQLVTKFVVSAFAFGLFFGLTLVFPTDLQAKSLADAKKSLANKTVDVTVTVHGSDVGVSHEVLEETVEKLLEAADIDVVKEGDGETIIELQIDIYKNDNGGFRAACDWDDDPEVEAEKQAANQDAIDDIVEEMVNTFIDFLHKG
jgi:hypothetical protein